MKVKNIAMLLIGGLCLASGLYAFEKKETDLTEVINSKVLETIESSKSIPGLNTNEFLPLKDEISDIWNTLMTEGVLEVCDKDEYIRPPFVALQAIVEHVLSTQIQQDISSLTGIIHTPMPTTPLCTEGEISEELVHPDIKLDPSRLLTVRARTTILRNYLYKGGDLYIVYPKEGLEKRSKLQQEVYRTELTKYPNLHDLPFKEPLPGSLIGATYLFEDRFGKTFVFAIQITQANNPQEKGRCGLWFGPINHPATQERICAVSEYMKKNGSSLLEEKITK